MALSPTLTQPLQQTMAAAPLGRYFEESGIFIKQDQRGCIPEILGCSAPVEYKVSKVAEDWDEILSAGVMQEADSGFPFEIFALEDSNCFTQNCLRDNRPTVLRVKTEKVEGSPLVEYHKPCSLPRGCCFMQPEFTTKLPNGTVLNRSKMVWNCWRCYPQATFEDPVGVEKFVVHPPLFFGCCMIPMCGPKKCFTVAFNFYDPVTGDQIEPNKKYPPGIRMVRQGAYNACWTTANDFAVNFPSDLNAEQKAGLMGLTLLLDMTLFEGQDLWWT